MGEIRPSGGKALQIATLGFRSASSQILGFWNLLTFRGLCHRGSGGQRSASLSIASAIKACGLWNPNARRAISRI